jgi:hypothetical protein
VDVQGDQATANQTRAACIDPDPAEIEQGPAFDVPKDNEGDVLREDDKQPKNQTALDADKD